MKKQLAKLLSSAVRTVAQNSADRNCEWIFYQPKVPATLKKD